MFKSSEDLILASISLLWQMYVTCTVQAKGTRLAKPVLSLGLMCLAFLTGLNRVAEYRNHWSDVIAGFVIGTAIATFLVRITPTHVICGAVCLCRREVLRGEECVHTYIQSIKLVLGWMHCISLACTTYTMHTGYTGNIKKMYLQKNSDFYLLNRVISHFHKALLVFILSPKLKLIFCHKCWLDPTVVYHDQ